MGIKFFPILQPQGMIRLSLLTAFIRWGSAPTILRYVSRDHCTLDHTPLSCQLLYLVNMTLDPRVGRGHSVRHTLLIFLIRSRHVSSFPWSIGARLLRKWRRSSFLGQGTHYHRVALSPLVDGRLFIFRDESLKYLWTVPSSPPLFTVIWILDLSSVISIFSNFSLFLWECLHFIMKVPHHGAMILLILMPMTMRFLKEMMLLWLMMMKFLRLMTLRERTTTRFLKPTTLLGLQYLIFL